MEISSIANNPPIQRLGYDLLLHIFEQNAHMFIDDDALITTRTASQVCQNWRSLMLATPLLWGRLLDFDILARSTGEGYWGDELVRRTGSSVLWIKARNSLAEEWPNRQLVVHFIKTVEDNLHRTQILVVDVDGTEWAIHHDLWNKIISLPAPQLETFDLTVASKRIGMTHRTSDPGRSFRSPAFADEAPRLRKFRAVQFDFNLRAPWVCGLRDLYIGHLPLFSEFLDALASAETLERLELHGFVSATKDDMRHLQPIRLPKLKQLCLFFDPNDCIAIMRFLKTPPDCALQCIASRQFLRFEDPFQAEDVAEKSFIGLVRRLSRYARKYFQHRVPTTLMLHSEDCELGITTCPRDGFGGFHLQIAQDLLDFTEKTKAAFLSEFTLPEFLHVTDLFLQIFDFECLPAISELFPFLGLLPSLQVLTICIRDIRFFDILKKELDPPRGILSSLKTIKIQPNNMSHTGLTEEDEILATSEFADALNKDGYPVEVVCSR